MIDFDRFSYLTFDCYGTLIDWETGILEAVRPVLAQHGIAQDDAEIIRLYAQAEAELEAGPYRRYRSVLRGVMARMADELGFQASDAEQERWRVLRRTGAPLRTVWRLSVASASDTSW